MTSDTMNLHVRGLGPTYFISCDKTLTRGDTVEFLHNPDYSKRIYDKAKTERILVLITRRKEIKGIDGKWGIFAEGDIIGRRIHEV